MCHPVLWSSPGMPEMLSPGGALVGAGLGTTVALLTDGRFSGASHGMTCIQDPRSTFELHIFTPTCNNCHPQLSTLSTRMQKARPLCVFLNDGHMHN